MSTVQSSSSATTIDYPDCDGEPIAGNSLQFDWIMTIKGGLDALFMDRPDVFVAGDLLWYPIEGDNKTRTAPDAMVAFGRPKGPRGSYRQWEEDNVAPQVVFEVLSPGNRSGEMMSKFAFYDHFEVEEYYQYDPDREPRPGTRSPLRGWIRTEGRLIEIPKMQGFMSPRLGIRFELGAGKDALTIHHPDGRPFIGFVEQVEQTKAERRRADEERRRADEEASRARTAEQQAQAERRRADALMAQLRAMGIEPEI